VAVVALAAPALFAQAPSKVGVINIQQAIISTKDGQKAAQEMQTKFDPRSKDLEQKQSEIQQLQAQFQKTQNTASEEQRTKLAREIDQKQKALQRDQEDARAEFEQEQGKVLNELGGRLMQVIDKYAKDNGFSLILDVSSQQSPVLYMASGLDITAEVVKMYDANAPSSMAAPAMPKPAATKPATPPPAKP
jgi:outer membrane protein